MRTISILFLVIILSVFLISGCASVNMTESPAASVSFSASSLVSAGPSPSLALSATASASPQTDPELESVIADFIAAQNAQDWNSFLTLWADSEQVFYKDFFAYPDNAEKHNGYFSIKKAELAGIYDITELVKKDKYSLDLLNKIAEPNWDIIDQYSDYKVVILKTDYDLEKEFWDYHEGLNYRVLALVPENAQWKVLQDYEGYSGAALCFNDPLPPEEEVSDNTEEPDNLVDGTVHFTKKLTGYYIGIQEGDYVHPGFKTIDGEEHWFWIEIDVENFETLHRYQKAEITYENLDKYIDEANMVINMDRITGIKLLD